MAPVFELTLTSQVHAPIEGTAESENEERPIDRSFLTDIAPDREALLLAKEQTIQSIRDALKLNSVDANSEYVDFHMPHSRGWG